MNRAAPFPRTAATLAVSLALFASACAVPLAPGYRILKESQSVKFVPGSAPELQIRTDYTLENTGNSELTFVDVALPDEKLFGRTNLRAEVDGRETALANLPAEYQEEQPNALRIPVDPPWKQKQTRQVEIEYTFSAPADGGNQITLGGEDFHLGSRGWFPLLQAPKHFLAPYPKRPISTAYTVRVPANFLVLARGKPAGRKTDGSEIEYSFDLGKRDLTPYIVAGRYVEFFVGSKSVPFWTHGSLHAQSDLQQADTQIAAAWHLLQEAFGTLGPNVRKPHIVESPELQGTFAGEVGPTVASFPGGVLVNPALLAQGIDNGDSLQRITLALAGSWFDEEMYPAPGAAVVMGEGLPEYATIAIEEARNGEPGRRQRILYYLEEYDQAKKAAAEKPLGAAMASDSGDERRMALAKAALFFAALEDACGQAQMRGGLKQLVALFSGEEAGYEDLRAELELSSGKDLAEMFRVWLNQKGIPEEFRARYQTQTVGHAGN
ncbi:MAG: hypothetical protein WA405_03950 [Candidatus Acidiferrales bacterium]